MSHVPKWIAEFTIKDCNECADKSQEQKAMRAERYKARTVRAAAIAKNQEKRLLGLFSTTAQNDKHNSIPLTRKRKGPQHDDEQLHQRKKLRSSSRKTNKRGIDITTGSADSSTSFFINKKKVGLSRNQIKEDIVVHGSEIEKAQEISQLDKSRENATGSADSSGTTSYCLNEEVVLSSNQVEEEFGLNKNEIGTPVEAPQPDESCDNADVEKLEYVYRLQRFHETHRQGLYPKDIWSRTSLMKHVERGSKGVTSRFISCCKTLFDLQCLGGITNESTRVREVVRINITKLKNYQDVTVIDLTDETVREKHINRSSEAWGFASRFNEVILEPRTHVPADCVEKIGIVHRRRFIQDEHVIL